MTMSSEHRTASTTNAASASHGLERSGWRASARATARLSRQSGFWAVAFSFLAVSAFSSAPSALYGLYAERDHLSSLTITVVYAVYAVGIVITLVLAGHVSDWYGRRSVLLPALGIAALAAVVFLVWRSLPGLLVARVLTGFALGITVATATAFIADLDAGSEGVATTRAGIVSTVANVGGLGLGPLIAGVLARYEPHALTLPFIVFLASLLCAVALVALAPEGHAGIDPRPRYRPQRLVKPADGQPQFIAAITGAFAAFAVGGLFAGLTGTFLTALVHHSSPALIGLAIFLSYGAGVAVQTTTTGWPAHRLLAAGIPPVIVGLVLLVGSAWTTPPSLTLFLLSSAIAGAGIGAMIRACLTIVISSAAPEDRARAVATVFTAGYAGVSIPVIGVGIVLQHLSPRLTLLIFALAVGLGILASARILVRPPAKPTSAPEAGADSMAIVCRCLGADVGHLRVVAREEPRDGRGPVTRRVPESTGRPRQRDDRIFPVLSASELAEIAAFGSEEPTSAGQLLFEAGDVSDDLFVVLEGKAEVARVDDSKAPTIAWYGPGDFIGELNLLTGQRRSVTCRVTVAGRVLVVAQDDFRRLMSVRPALARTIFNALLARRELLRSGDGAQAIRIVGSRYSPQAMSLRTFAEHAHLAYAWVDVEDAADGEALLESLGLRPQDIPAVITPTETLRRASTAVFAEHLGLTFRPTPGFIFDLVVVGSGPAGLAASVYGASEGLRTVCLDSVTLGGQAGTSSRIENYAGFPNGISGEDLTGRTAAQAMRLGARLNAPCEVTGVRSESDFHVVALSDGSEIPTRAVIVASGAHYRRLPVEDLDHYEGAGVYYAATDLEARICAKAPVVVVGGGNSAGQAAIYLAQNDCRVTIAIRREDLAQTMSRYLIERIEADPEIDLLTGVEVRRLGGDTRLEEVTLTHIATGRQRQLQCAGLFCFIGARPETDWLGNDVLLDEDGFVLTDRHLPAAPVRLRDDALPFETSVRGVFAAGDVRHGSVKRVAAAVGEGSSAVRSVHERLASQTTKRFPSYPVPPIEANGPARALRRLAGPAGTRS